MIVRTHQKADAASEAVYSDCLSYRYRLTRVWDPAGPKALLVMLNPSTATEVQTDPTVERCERRARDTDPKKMRVAVDPVGPANDAAIADSSLWADRIVAAWGTHGAHLDRGLTVERLLRATGLPLHVLGLTKAGHPQHPLYIGYDRQPVLWSVP